MSRQRARKILLDAFWTSQGWRRNPAIAPEEFDLAKREGFMFDPSRLGHDEAVAAARSAKDRVSAREVAHAFVASLGERRLEYRSALGSYALGRLLPLHDPVLRDSNPVCLVCGLSAVETLVDWNILNFERHKWGGVRHDSPEYIGLDLRLFADLEEVQPSASDWDALRSLMEAIRTQPPAARAGDLEKAIRGIFPSNQAERRIVLETLGYLGIIHPVGQASPFDEYVPYGARVMPPSAKNDWRYPTAWWRGSDGLREDALRYWFPEIS